MRVNISDSAGKPQQLNVLWTSGDREVALNMAFMYTYNSKVKGWWEEVCLIVWGASATLLAADSELQDKVRQMLEAGVEVVACKACADNLGVTAALEEMGVEVKYMGQPLTHLLKERAVLLTV